MVVVVVMVMAGANAYTGLVQVRGTRQGTPQIHLPQTTLWGRRHVTTPSTDEKTDAQKSLCSESENSNATLKLYEGFIWINKRMNKSQMTVWRWEQLSLVEQSASAYHKSLKWSWRPHNAEKAPAGAQCTLAQDHKACGLLSTTAEHGTATYVSVCTMFFKPRKELRVTIHMKNKSQWKEIENKNNNANKTKLLFSFLVPLSAKGACSSNKTSWSLLR